MPHHVSLRRNPSPTTTPRPLRPADHRSTSDFAARLGSLPRISDDPAPHHAPAHRTLALLTALDSAMHTNRQRVASLPITHPDAPHLTTAHPGAIQPPPSQ